VFETVYSCTKVFRAPFIKEILMMEVLSETEFSGSDNGFIPNYFIDISAYLDKKISIMRNYRSELKAHPFPRSIQNIRALATYRGATAGCRYAEGFIQLKRIA
jgi:LmbE family N-acetylglucosaminyl deacetylase